MIIVWISVGLIVASLVFFGIFAVRTMKESKPVITKMNATVTRIKQQTETIKTQTNHLTATQAKITEDIEYKKQAINYPVNEAKQIVPRLKTLWAATPFSSLMPKK
ncbi:DUF948 domain-containing protein [Pradoshia sp.]